MKHANYLVITFEGKVASIAYSGDEAQAAKIVGEDAAKGGSTVILVDTEYGTVYKPTAVERYVFFDINCEEF